MFSILSGTLLEAVRLDQADWIVYLSTYRLDNPEQQNWVSVPEYQDFKEQREASRSWARCSAPPKGGPSAPGTTARRPRCCPISTSHKPGGRA